jgi:hypothetical protein
MRTCLVALLLYAGSSAAAEPPTALDRVRRLEVVEMLTAIAGGSQMGPGEGWFHPGQSRYGWAWLAERYGLDRGGSLDRKQFDGPPDTFARLDRSRDGVLSAEDFDWSDKSPLQREAGVASRWARMFDQDSNGRVSREEWNALFERAAKDKGYLTADDLRDALPVAPPRRPPGPPPASEGPSPAVLIQGLLSGELGSFLEGPAVGERAPNFGLPTHDGKQRYSLAQYCGFKPVVLIFGSFT